MLRLATFLTIGISLLTNTAKACLCDLRPLKENAEQFPFIAHVRIVQKLGVQDTVYYKKESITNIRYRGAPVLVMEIMELFKGSDTLRTIVEYDVNSSCEIGVNEGEEWIIFAEYFDRTKVWGIAACTPSVQYRNKKGERRWDQYAEGLLQNLRKHFNHTAPDCGYNGLHKGLYANGKVEWVAFYTNGQLDDNRKIYFANGRLHFDEQFVNGQPDGWHKEYYRNGKLHKESLYSNGKCIKSKEWGHPSDRNRYRGLYEEYYYRDSTYSILKQYDEKGRLKQETEYNDSADMYEQRQYYPSGQLEYKSTTWRREYKTVQLFWKKDGTFEKKRTYIGTRLIED
jgi:antitoxin component YwqK of YwqJK toxin-antitoxin module